MKRIFAVLIAMFLLLGMSGTGFAREIELESYTMTFTLSANYADVLLEIDVGNENLTSMKFNTDQMDRFRVYDSKGPLEYKINQTGSGMVTEVFLHGSIQFFIEFSSDKFIYTSGDIKQFLLDLSMEFVVKNVRIAAKLPVGYITDSHYPKTAGVTSDGSRIILTWDFEKPNSVLVSARFRKAENLSLWPVFIGIVIAIAGIAAVVYYRKRSHEKFLLGFTEDEARVINHLRAAKMTYQNKVEQEHKFSRAKMTRIVKRLEEKGLLEKRKKGRTNRLTWVGIRGKAARMNAETEEKKETRKEKQETGKEYKRAEVKKETKKEKQKKHEKTKHHYEKHERHKISEKKKKTEKEDDVKLWSYKDIEG